MIVTLHAHPAYPLGTRLAHDVPDFYAADPENHPITVKIAVLPSMSVNPDPELHPSPGVREVDATFVFVNEDEDGTLNYLYKEKSE